MSTPEATSSIDTPLKRRHVEDSEPTDQPPNIPIDPELTYAHRTTLRGRATLSNAADSVYFSKNRALVFHFVDMFDVVTDEIGRLVSCTLKCGICRRGAGWQWVKGGKSKGSTSNMINHMKDKHHPIWLNALRADWAASGKPLASENPSIQTQATEPSKPDFNVDEFYRRVTRWIVTGNQPFTEVENQEFQELLTYLKPALNGHLIKSQAIRDRVFSHADSLRQSTKKYLTSLSGLMAVSCDAWTSSNRIAFLAIVGSWITHDWHLEETLLDFVELHGAHDGQNMSVAVASALTELGIEDKLVALVSDNASTNGTLIRHLSTSLNRSSTELRWDPEKGQIRCLAHVIHLAVMSLLRSIKAVPSSTDIRDFDPKDLLLTIEEAEAFVASNNAEVIERDDATGADPSVDLTSAIDKIRKISKIVRSSPQRTELFRATATQIEEWHEQQALGENRAYTKKTIKNLVLDVITRWNSVFFMLERALEFSEAIDSLVNHPKVTIYRQYALSKSEWAAIVQVCKWLKFFRNASAMMSAEKYPTLSFSLRVYFLLISYVLDLEKSSITAQSPSLLAGVLSCKEKLLEFFDKSTYDSEYYYFAAILDPRFKDTLFKSNKGLTAKLFSKAWLNDCANAFRETCEEFYSTHYPENEDFGTQASTSKLEDDDADEFTRAWNAQLPSTSGSRRGSPSSSVSAEIASYLSEQITGLAPLSWWRLNAHRFPRLAAMARDFLSIPGTSVAVERVFSAGRDVISVRRESLSAETIRTLMTYRAGIMLEKQIERTHTH